MPDFHTFSYRSGPVAKSVAATILVATVLGGCTAPGSGMRAGKYEPTYLRLTEERIFAQSLRQRYLELATNAYDRGDMARSDFYSLRALMAVEGKLAQPAMVKQMSLPSSTAHEADQAHSRLTTAMMSGVRTGAPDLAARAQAAFDCWVLESGPEGDAGIAQSCRYNTFETLARLEAASVGAQVAHAGGHEYPAPQSYVITAGTPSQTIQTNGVTIEVLNQSHASAAPRRVVPAATHRVESVPAPMTVETIRYTEPQFEAPVAYDPAPMMHNETVDLGVYDQHVAVMSAEPAYVNTVPVSSVPEITVEMPSQTSIARPVYGSETSETIQTVAISDRAIKAAGAANALMDAQASMQSDFAIYFGFDSDKVTPEAEDVLVDTVEKLKLSGAKRVTLTGFTDSMGDARYNQLLAMRRAQAVRKYLNQALGNDVAFEILPIGEVQAVSNGGDGVMEALNRRVEISIQ